MTQIRDEDSNSNEIVKEKLDKCAILLIECYEKILSQRKQLDANLNDGYLNLSKARSQVGCVNLSAMQIPLETLEATLTIDTTDQKIIDKTDQDDDFEYETLNYNVLINGNKAITDQIGQLPKWFGALPSLSLKQSHKSFTKSIEILTSIAELQTNLKSLNKVYSDLCQQLKE